VAGQPAASTLKELRAKPLPPGYEALLQGMPNGAVELRLRPRPGS
jgi:hypothetical protein